MRTHLCIHGYLHTISIHTRKPLEGDTLRPSGKTLPVTKNVPYLLSNCCRGAIVLRNLSTLPSYNIPSISKATKTIVIVVDFSLTRWSTKSQAGQLQASLTSQQKKRHHTTKSPVITTTSGFSSFILSTIYTILLFPTVGPTTAPTVIETETNRDETETNRDEQRRDRRHRGKIGENE